MPQEKQGPRIKVTFTPTELDELRAIARARGLPVAKLVRMRALDPDRIQCPIDKVLKAIAELAPGLPAPAKKTPAKSYDRKPGPTPARTPDSIWRSELTQRFGGDKALGARLSQLGGRDGKLFDCHPDRLARVYDITAALDPDGIPWLPTDSTRAFWVPSPNRDRHIDLYAKAKPPATE